MSSFTGPGHGLVTLLIERLFLFFFFSSQVETKIAMFNEQFTAAHRG